MQRQQEYIHRNELPNNTRPSVGIKLPANLAQNNRSNSTRCFSSFRKTCCWKPEINRSYASKEPIDSITTVPSPPPLLCPVMAAACQLNFSRLQTDLFSLAMGFKYRAQSVQAAFFMRTSGESMRNASIHVSDLLTIDRSRIANNQYIIRTAIDGDLTANLWRGVSNVIFSLRT